FSQFASFRAADQLHTDICYQNVNVKVIATHSGTSFGQAGSTHHAICDLAVTRSIPNLTVIVPADGVETYNAVMAAYETPGPFYIRINRGFDRVLYKDSNYGFEVGKAVTVKEGTDITVIACGSCVFQALQAAEFLEKTDGLKVRVLDMHTIKPIDKEAIQKAVFETRRILTVEDHNILGGLGSAVAEVVVDYGKACAFKKLGIPDKFAPIGLHEDIMSIVGIDSNGIIEAVREVMGKDFELDDDWDDEV
ncbi:MAG: transketolase family protein, partial [Clostridiales bacterium]|nr:transketolase family protein [Clostridiales bacterium]